MLFTILSHEAVSFKIKTETLVKKIQDEVKLYQGNWELIEKALKNKIEAGIQAFAAHTFISVTWYGYLKNQKKGAWINNGKNILFNLNDFITIFSLVRS